MVVTEFGGEKEGVKPLERTMVSGKRQLVCSSECSSSGRMSANRLVTSRKCYQILLAELTEDCSVRAHS